MNKNKNIDQLSIHSGVDVASSTDSSLDGLTNLRQQDRVCVRDLRNSHVRTFQ